MTDGVVTDGLVSATTPHILYSFRRCPYAIRARMALAVAGISVEHREVLLKDKPAQMLTLSPKGTVPVLQRDDGEVLDESIDIMCWALGVSDPQGWLRHDAATQKQMHNQVAAFEDNFKPDLDAYKYSARPDDAASKIASMAARERCEIVLAELEQQLSASGFLYGNAESFADVALFPFIRQFANVEANWFQTLKYECLQRWLSGWLAGEMFLGVMRKYPRWEG